MLIGAGLSIFYGVILAVIGFIPDNTVAWFIGRHVIYRVFELVIIYLVLAPYQTSWNVLMFWKSVPVPPTTATDSRASSAPSAVEVTAERSESQEEEERNEEQPEEEKESSDSEQSSKESEESSSEANSASEVEMEGTSPSDNQHNSS